MSPAKKKPATRASRRQLRPGTPDVAALTRFLHSIGVDTEHDEEYSLTAPLLAELMFERTAGLREEPPSLRPLPYRGHPGETVAIEAMYFYGLCPHHLVPYFGEVSVRYVPRQRLCGAGALVRARARDGAAASRRPDAGDRRSRRALARAARRLRARGGSASVHGASRRGRSRPPRHGSAAGRADCGVRGVRRGRIGPAAPVRAWRRSRSFFPRAIVPSSSSRRSSRSASRRTPNWN